MTGRTNYTIESLPNNLFTIYDSVGKRNIGGVMTRKEVIAYLHDLVRLQEPESFPEFWECDCRNDFP